MTDSYIQLPLDGAGKKTRTTEDTVNGSLVHTQIIKIADDNNNIIVPSKDTQYTQAVENNASGLPIYVGEAVPSSAKSAAAWRIKKLTYDGNGFLTDVQWADGTAAFTKVWDDRTGYSFS